MIREATAFLEKELVATLAAAGHPGAMPSFGLGARALTAADSPPRITWVPVRARHDRAKASNSDLRQTPKHIWTRHLTIEAHVWTDDETQAEVLMQHLASTLEAKVGAGGYSLLGEEWTQTDVTSDGVKLVVGIEFRMPLTTEPLKTTRVTSVAVGGTVEEAFS